CGAIGAKLAYLLQYYFGWGTIALLVALTAWAVGLTKGVRFSDPWLRFVGFAFVCAACSAMSSIFLPVSASQTLAGAGGVLGTATSFFLVQYFDFWGTALILTAALLIGLILCADNLVIALARWIVSFFVRSVPVIRDQSINVAHAGVAAIGTLGTAGASLINTMTGRLATAGAAVGEAARDAAPRKRKRTDTATFEEPEESYDEDEEWDEASADDDVEYEEDDSEESEEEYEEDEDEDVEEDDIEASEDDDDEPVDEEEAKARSAAKVRDIVLNRLRANKPKTPPAIGADTDPRPQPINYDLPPLSLLETAPPVNRSEVERACQDKAVILEQTLREFKVDVEVVGIETGPVITVFELKLTPGVKVSRIASLTNDMARAMKAPAVRVVAPLPGRNTIGIEVPNIDKEKVRIKEIMQVFGKQAESQGIPLYLGKDASGAPLVSDLTRMPHMLIAGTTGSGKSVCISSIVMSILMTRSPEDVKLILVDPKVVELAMFKDIPHLMCPIVTEMPKAEGILDWAATKMDERYALLAEAGVKDIRSYNRLGIEGLKERMAIESDEEMGKIPVKLPYIVIVIDELADLMMTSAKEVEFYLCRIAQKSRAVGIHLIVSTQRPQANVVTGLIKSNLPSRIAFRVASRLDSRIVLDQNGGEVLMGQGDMLFLPPGQSKLMRAQGTYIADEELRAIVKHAKAQGEPQYSPELMRVPSAEAEGVTERDELFDQAVDAIIETRRGSVSLLQRRLTIGYGRASRLIDQMFAAGIVGDYKGSQAREVMVTKEEWAAIKAQRDAEEASEGSLLDNI
ncbi:MAG: DNA translocase FtsK, partial [Phycisphaerae bacterium]